MSMQIYRIHITDRFLTHF